MLRSGLLLLLVAAVGCAAIGDTSGPGADAGQGATVDARVAVPDARLTADAEPGQPDAGVCAGQVQLLENGGFEAASAAWSASGGSIILPAGAIPISPAAGAYAARLLAQNSASHRLEQAVSVPPGATSLALTGMRCWVTEESAGVFDTLRIELLDSGSVVETLLAISNQDAGALCDWLAFETIAATAHSGENLSFRVQASSDDNTFTSFYFDSLALTATCD